MTGIIILIGIVAGVAMINRLYDIDMTAPHPFECGSDEVCHCKDSPNCMKDEK
jgi:hypothetical protein